MQMKTELTFLKYLKLLSSDVINYNVKCWQVYIAYLHIFNLLILVYTSHNGLMKLLE